MLQGIIGKKIGMTQCFDLQGRVIPVTVIDVGHWFVTQVKVEAVDGYAALQLGFLKKRYQKETFSSEWLKKKAKYFAINKEVRITSGEYQLGQRITFEHVAFIEGNTVSVTGRSKGLGFQGVVKRWNFAGGPKSHGSKFHRRPGSSGHLRRQGEIIKGKRFPGHTGDEQVTVSGLKVIRIDHARDCLFLKGAVPGRKDSYITIKRQEAK